MRAFFALAVVALSCSASDDAVSLAIEPTHTRSSTPPALPDTFESARDTGAQALRAIVDAEIEDLKRAHTQVSSALEKAAKCVTKNANIAARNEPAFVASLCKFHVKKDFYSFDSLLARSLKDITKKVKTCVDTAFNAFALDYGRIIDDLSLEARIIKIMFDIELHTRHIAPFDAAYQRVELAYVAAQFDCTEQEYMFILHLRDANVALKAPAKFDLTAWNVDYSDIIHQHQSSASALQQLVSDLCSAMLNNELLVRIIDYMESMLHKERYTLQTSAQNILPNGGINDALISTPPPNSKSVLGANSLTIKILNKKISNRRDIMRQTYSQLMSAAGILARIVCFQLHVHGRVEANLNGYSVVQKTYVQFNSRLGSISTTITRHIATRANLATNLVCNNESAPEYIGGQESKLAAVAMLKAHGMSFDNTPYVNKLRENNLEALSAYDAATMNEMTRRKMMSNLSSLMKENKIRQLYPAYKAASKSYVSEYLKDIENFYLYRYSSIDLFEAIAEQTVLDKITTQ